MLNKPTPKRRYWKNYCVLTKKIQTPTDYCTITFCGKNYHAFV